MRNNYKGSLESVREHKRHSASLRNAYPPARTSYTSNNKTHAASAYATRQPSACIMRNSVSEVRFFPRTRLKIPRRATDNNGSARAFLACGIQERVENVNYYYASF